MNVRRLLGNLALAAGAVAVTLVVGEIGIRIAGVDAAAPGAELLTGYDSLLGWSKLPNDTVENRTSEFDVVEITNSRGLRGPELPLTKPPHTRRVLLLGDSFLEGYTVNRDDLVSEVVERTLTERTGERWEVINAGTAGYSTDQELLFFQLYGAAYGPDITVVLFYVNDVWFNAQSRYWRGSKPRFRLDADSLILTNVPVPPPDPETFAFAVTGGSGLVGLIRRTDAWFGQHSRLYFLLRSTVLQAPAVQGFMIRRGLTEVPGEWLAWAREPTAEVARAWEITDALLTRLHDIAAERGSTFGVFYVPSRPSVDADDWARTRSAYAMDDEEWSPAADGDMLRQICQRRMLVCEVDVDRFVHAADSLSRRGATRGLYFREDAHWTPEGHRVAGEAITDLILRRLAPTEAADASR